MFMDMKRQSETRIGSSRREFLGAAAAALFAGITITLVGCGEESTGPKAGAGDIAAEIDQEAGHGHSAILKKAEIDAGGAVTLHIQGGASHDHTVTLTSDDMAELKKGNMVHKDSSVASSHSHMVMFMVG